jgi:imidazolonepropionase-like amidohydrolase
MIALLLAVGLAQAECTALVGDDDGVVLVMEGGEIQSLGSPAPAGCTVVSLPEGAQVTPAFIESSTALGLVEVSLEQNTVDSSSNESDPVRAALTVVDGYNPRSTLIGVARLGGIGTAVLVPGGGLISGQSAAVDLVGNTQAEALIAGSVAMHASVGGRSGSRSQTFMRLREVLEDARAYGRNRNAFEGDRYRDLAAERLDLEALQPVLSREIPLVVSVQRASDIEALLRLGEDVGIRLVLVGAAEGWLLAKQLAAAEVPVVLNPLVYGPGSFEQIHARADNAALLHAAGVQVVISSFSSHNARTLRQAAGNAVRGGLPHDVALAAITRTPADVFGLDRHGRLEPGAVANVAVWSGDPLEPSSELLHLVLRGEEIPLTSRQTALFEKYRSLGD